MRRRKEPQKFPFKAVGIIALILIIFAFSSYILFFSSIFRISNININYSNKITPSWNKNVNDYYKNYKGRNIFFVSIDSSTLLDKYPVINDIKINKSYPWTLNIEINEHAPSVLFQTPSNTLVYSDNGQLIEAIKNSSNKYKNLPYVLTKDKDIPKDSVVSIIKLVSALENDKKNIVTSFNFVSPATLTAYYSGGNQIVFTTQKDVNTQINEVHYIQQYIGFDKCKVMDVRFNVRNVYCSG